MQKIQKLQKALEKNNIIFSFAENCAEARLLAKTFLDDGCTVAVGGSLSLRQTGIQQMIEEGPYRYTNRYVKGTFSFDTSLDEKTVRKSYLDAYEADVYFTSANALTQNGELVYVDGQGNRISAIAFGPRKVVNVVGINKIVPDLPAAFERIACVAAPANNRRYERATPCVKLGKCVQCASPQRGCSDYMIVSHQKEKERMYVILVNETLGF